MTKREAQRIVRRALKMTGMSPEAFVAAHGRYLYGTSARTLRRWRDGETEPHPAVVASLAAFLGRRMMLVDGTVA